jgi:hypothetical protein
VVTWPHSVDDIGGFLITWLPIIFFGIIIWLLLRTMALVPKVKPAMVDRDTTDPVGWDDVAGADEAKEELKDRPEAENLLNIYAALADQDRDTVIAQFAGQQFSGFKTALADLTVARLSPIAAEMRRLLADPAEIDRVLKDGAARARAIATPIMTEIKKRVGFIS